MKRFIVISCQDFIPKEELEEAKEELNEPDDVPLNRKLHVFPFLIEMSCFIFPIQGFGRAIKIPCFLAKCFRTPLAW